MNCPYCKREMLDGYIKTPRGVIAWTPEGEKSNVLQSRAKECQIALGTPSGVGATTVRTAWCEPCDVFIITQRGQS